MAVRTSEAEWKGNLMDGKGSMRLGSGAYEGSYSFKSRFEEGEGTNPEELIAAAHAGCFSMALAGHLTSAGYEPKRVHTVSRIKIEKREDRFTIISSELVTEAEVPGIDDATFQEQAQLAKAGCPVSRALGAIEITLDAKLV